MPDSIYGFPQSSSALLYITNPPDVPPTNPTPWDDEFDGNILNPKWTIWNQPAGGTVTVHDGMVTMVSPYNIQSRAFAILQKAPLENWKVRAKLIHDGAQDNYYGLGLIARRITGADKSLTLGSLFHSGQGISMMTLWSWRLNGTTLNDETDLYNHQSHIFYLEMEYDGTNITYRISHSGAAYSHCYQYAAASYPGGAPEWIGIYMHNYSGFTSDLNMALVSSCEWFRRIL